MAELALGIDLGTTYSAAAIVQDGKPILIPSRSGGRLTPSMIGFLPSGKRAVGDEARQLLEVLPENVAASTKRFIGQRWTPDLASQAKLLVAYPLVAGPNGDVRAKIADRALPVTQIAAMILGELKLDAQTFLGVPVNKAVITVPANFDDGQRQATKEAAEIAGLEVLRLVNEPTAAALAFGLQQKVRGRALVFDLGGGTFDVSVLELRDELFDVVATGGDPFLGGDDFDSSIVRWLLAQTPANFRDPIERDKLSMQRLRNAAERAKRELSGDSQAAIEIAELGDHAEAKRYVDLNTTLTRDFFEMICRPLTRRCIEVCEEVMVEGYMSPSKVEALLLIGGMTRVPCIQRAVSEYFGREPEQGIPPDEAVALGAALLAHQLVQKSDAAVLRDVASHALGVEMLGGRMRRLIEKNTSLPASAKETFLPAGDGQTSARIRIFQGESALCSENAPLGEVVLEGLRVESRAENELQVSFELDVDGTLSVQAHDVKTGAARNLVIQARTELAPRDVERLRKEESKHASDEGAVVIAEWKAKLEKSLARGFELLAPLQTAVRVIKTPEAEATFERFDALLQELAAAQKRGQWLPALLEDFSAVLEQAEKLANSI